LFDSIKKNPHPEEAAQAAVSKDALRRSGQLGILAQPLRFSPYAATASQADLGSAAKRQQQNCRNRILSLGLFCDADRACAGNKDT
jgi:hypothetical protein